MKKREILSITASVLLSLTISAGAAKALEKTDGFAANEETAITRTDIADNCAATDMTENMGTAVTFLTSPVPAKTTASSVMPVNGLLTPDCGNNITIPLNETLTVHFENAVTDPEKGLFINLPPKSGKGAVYSSRIAERWENGTPVYGNGMLIAAFKEGDTAVFYEDTEGKNCIIYITVTDKPKPVTTCTCKPVTACSYISSVNEATSVTDDPLTPNNKLIPAGGCNINMECNTNKIIYFENAVVNGILFRTITGTGSGKVYPEPYSEINENGEKINGLKLAAYGSGNVTIYVKDDEEKSCLLNVNVSGEDEQTTTAVTTYITLPVVDTKPVTAFTTAEGHKYTTTASAGPGTHPVYTTIINIKLHGDLNGDQKVNVADLVYMQRLINKDMIYTDAADMNNDGTINVFDIILLKRKILGG